MPWKINQESPYRSQARPKQLPPDTPNWLEMLETIGELKDVSIRQQRANTLEGLPEELDFFLWFIMAGRGFGKSFTGSGWVNEKAEQGRSDYGMLLGRSADDVRAFMIEGESGILRLARPDFYPRYEPSKLKLTYPNGVVVNIRYAEEPKGVRGPNNGFAWVDEPASFQDAMLGMTRDTAMSNLLMTLRKGKPQLCMTGTPKPFKLIKEIVKGDRIKNTVLVNGSSYENRDNLAPEWFEEVILGYEGTSLAAQEVYGSIIDENPDALWRRSYIDPYKVVGHPDLEQVVVAVDPAATSKFNSAETGIVVAGKAKVGEVYHYYVLSDRTPREKLSPKGWAGEAVSSYNVFNADVIVAESNNGGEMVSHTINTVDANVPVKLVWASRGKEIRAQPVSSLYEKGLVHHVGSFSDLEEELTTWEPGMESPNRLDALVWAITYLMGRGKVESDTKAHDDFWNDPSILTDNGDILEDHEFPF